MSSVVAIVKRVVGQVIAVSPEGVQRVLIEGDRLFAGDQVLTGLSGAVTLELSDGRTLDLGRESQWSADAPTSTTDLEEATAQAAPSVEELQQAIAAGADPTQDLEATAAGAQSEGSGAPGGGHSVVMLDATAAVVDPTIGYETAGLSFAAEADDQFTGAPDTTNAQTTAAAAAGPVVSLTATPSTTETGVIVYTATLTSPVPGTSPFSVFLSNGMAITIVPGNTSGTVQITAPNDVYNGTTSTSVSINSVSSNVFPAGVQIDQTPAVTTITDIVDTTFVQFYTNSNTVAEGGVITYTALVTSPVTGSPVVVALSNGQSITIAVGSSTGSVDFTVPSSVYNSGSISTSIVSVTGGNFESLVPASAPVVVNVADSIDTTTVSLSVDPTAPEGGVLTLTASVTSPVTQTDLVVILNTGRVIVIPVGSTSGSVQVTVPNDVYTGGSIFGARISAVSGGDFENLVANTTPVYSTITDVDDTTTITLSATPSASENGVITYTVTVDHQVLGTPVVVTLSNGHAVTIGPGLFSGSIDVAVPNDVYNSGPIAVTITGFAGGDEFERLVTDPTPVVTTVTDTVDTTTVNLGASASVAENGVITYTASVASPVTGTPVVVTLSNGQTITIPVGGTTGSVNVTVPNDVYNGAPAVSTTITSVAGGNFENLVGSPTPAVTTVTDSVDTTTVSLGASPSVAENGVITYTASVASPVTGTPVVVTLSNGQTITIPVGGTSGTVNVTAPNDVYNGAAPISTTITGVAGGNFESLVANPAPAVTTVTDTTDTTTVSLGASPSVGENGLITYTASVTSPVTGAPVVVTLSNGQTITIPVGGSSGTVQVAAPNDVYNGAPAVSTTITNVAGGNFESLV
ncbi:MAG: retention module-containing protein, partial [Paucimonas sp.]|nr:retention module-containing protein [Paucimonas sp.]